MAATRTPHEILTDVVQLVVGMQVPISIVGAKMALGVGHEAWERLRDDITGGYSVGWLGTDTAPYIERLVGACSSDAQAKLLAQDVIAMAYAGGMPDTYWQTDRRIARACEVLGVTPDVARETTARAFEDAQAENAAKN